MTYDFSLDRKTTVTLGAGSVVLLVLVFVAGLLTGLTWRSDQDQMASIKPASPAAKAAEPSQAAAAAPKENSIPAAAAAAVESPVPAAPAAAPAESNAPAAPPAAPTADRSAPVPAPPVAPAATPAAAPAVAPSPDAVTPGGVELAIQVGAFLDKSNADKLAERLKEQGYSSQIVLGGHAPKQWNFVRVGPYHDWEEASEIAAVISRDQATQAVVRPMR
jgi:cell division septation protein DedD